MYKVLIFPAWTEIALEINRALKYCKDIQLFWASSPISNHAPFVFENYFETIRPIRDWIWWIDDINALVKEHNIDCFVPTYDEIILESAMHRDKFLCPVVSSSVEVWIITRSKIKTYNKLQWIVPIPELYSLEDISHKNIFPVFAKPDKWQWSEWAFKANNFDELNYQIKKSEKEYVICEYLPWEEYTIDCFSSKNKWLLFASWRERIRMRNWISMASKLINLPEFQLYADAISNALWMTWSWFFQLKRDKQWLLKLLEVAPRIGGTNATSRMQWVNFPLLSIYEALWIDININTNVGYSVVIDRALTNNYKLEGLSYNTIYVDLDDTLIINNKINTFLVRYLYQSINKWRKINLITKNESINLQEYLNSYRLWQLFDKIIQLKKTEEKSDHILEKNAIFIDDSFSERIKIQKIKWIPAFDTDMIESLMDETNF